MSHDWQPGELAKCVEACDRSTDERMSSNDWGRSIAVGEELTVRSVTVCEFCDVVQLRFAGIKSAMSFCLGGREAGYPAPSFVPIVKREPETDISVFTKILKTTKKELETT